MTTEKIIKCLHEYPCHTNMCPKALCPEDYLDGVCYTHKCDAIDQYCKLTQKDYNFCPRCGEKLHK